DGRKRVLFHCFAGCSSYEVFVALIRRGFINPGRDGERHDGGRGRLDHDVHHQQRYQIAHYDPKALAIWRESAPATGTIIESTYLKGVRGTITPPPPSLQYSIHPYADRIRLPAMIAAVQARDGKLTTVQITWLDRRTYERFKRKNVSAL